MQARHGIFPPEVSGEEAGGDRRSTLEEMAASGHRALQERMLTLLIFVLAVYGLSNGATVLKARVVTRFLLGRIPVVRGIAYCPACFAFWAAGVASILVLSPSSAVVEDRWLAALVDSFVGSGSTWILHTVQERLTHGVPEPDEQCPAAGKP